MSTQIATELEQRVVDSINAERAAAGLPALKVEVHLNAASQGHSDWMAETGAISHSGEGGSTPTERIDAADFPLEGNWHTAENVASAGLTGPLDAGEVDAMHENLMESEGHRANMLDPGVSYVGVGLSVGMATLGDMTYDAAFLTENFADTGGQVLVQEEIDGQTMLQSYLDGEAVGDPVPADTGSDGDDDDDDGTGGEADPDEQEDEDADSASGGGCFVATAAYGDRLHPDVVALRGYRDEVLARNAAGRAFIRAYRALGPHLARAVRPHRTSGRIARALLAPLARLARR
jgi:hypothetical protein